MAAERTKKETNGNRQSITPLDEPEYTLREEIMVCTYVKIDVDACCVSLKEYRNAEDPTVSTLFVVVFHSEMTV